MAVRRVLLVLVAVFGCVSASSLRVAPVAKPTEDDEAKVVKLHASLEKMAAGVTTMLDPNGSLARTAIAPEMKTFLAELQKTLKETEGEKDSKKALKRLQDAQAGVQSLTRDMTLQQTRLMKEGEDQEVNLLMGVLMTRKNDPMPKQLEVFESSEFEKLAVVKAVLAAKDAKTPLFQQVAGWLDQHAEKGAKPQVSAKPVEQEIPNKLAIKKDGKPDVSPIVNALSMRLHNLEDGGKRQAQLHAQEDKDLEAAIKKEEKNATKQSAKAVHRIKLMQKKDDREFEKRAAMSKHDIASLETAIGAIEKGDMKGLMAAQSALASSLKAMEAKTSGFLYLIQLGHRATNRDCPFCAAQCFDKCHAAGKSYVECLTDCQDAGK